MLFTEADINKILTHVDLMTAKMVAQVLGRDFITKADLELLKSKGVDLVKLIPKFPYHQQAFLFGRLSVALADNISSSITYPEFEKFLSNMGLFSPQTSEMQYYHVAANKTYTHIKGLGDKIKNSVRNIISAEELAYLQAEQIAKTQEVLKKEILAGTYERRMVKKISSNIAHQINDWNRDWGRIVETESQDVFNMGRALELMNNNEDPEVYFDVFPGACRHCIRLHLTRGIGSQPRVFKISTLLANGTNYGIKSKDWKPTIHPVHPHCRCNIRNKPRGYIWDESSRQFAPPANYERKVKRTSRAKITVAGKEYLV